MQIRVSSVISNGPIILNVDCDMYSNNSDAIRDAMCFFLDEEMGHKIAFVQHPQNYSNLTKNNIYGNSFSVLNHVSNISCKFNIVLSYIAVYAIIIPAMALTFLLNV
jgi:hypothetical protein